MMSLALSPALPAAAQTALVPDAATFAAGVIQQTNAVRAASRLPALRRDARLDRAAALHAQEMARTGRLTHVGLNGSLPGQRITTQGYRFSGWGENILAGYNTPAEAVQAWMSSAPHRANLLSATRRDVGVGAVWQNGQYFVVMDVATPAVAAPPAVKPPTLPPGSGRLPIIIYFPRRR